jgi:hypothetical protein
MDWNAQFEPRGKTASTLVKQDQGKYDSHTDNPNSFGNPCAYIFAVVWRWHPSVLWHFLTDNLRYRLVKLGVLSGAAKHVAEVRAAFDANAMEGQFKSYGLTSILCRGVLASRESLIVRAQCAFLKSGRGKGVQPFFS